MHDVPVQGCPCRYKRGRRSDRRGSAGLDWASGASPSQGADRRAVCVWVCACVCVRESISVSFAFSPLGEGGCLWLASSQAVRAGRLVGWSGWLGWAGLGGLHGQARCVGDLAGWLLLPAAPPHCEMQQSLRSLGFDRRYTGTQTSREWVDGMYLCT
jgi:hypothetical protein